MYYPPHVPSDAFSEEKHPTRGAVWTAAVGYVEHHVDAAKWFGKESIWKV